MIEMADCFPAVRSRLLLQLLHYSRFIQDSVMMNHAGIYVIGESRLITCAVERGHHYEQPHHENSRDDEVCFLISHGEGEFIAVMNQYLERTQFYRGLEMITKWDKNEESV